MVYYLLLVMLLCCGSAWVTLAHGQSAPPVQLASEYQSIESLHEYWVSEKLDGVRAYWNGQALLTRQGNRIQAPDWFTAGFPSQPLDGELWMGRGTFDVLSGTVRRQVPDDEAWRRVRFMVFDLPGKAEVFSERLRQMAQLLEAAEVPWLQPVDHFRVRNRTQLMLHLDDVIAGGGEGLMLHHGLARHVPGRSPVLMKLKPWQDAEAEVIRHVPGEGRHAGVMGALLVRGDDGRHFRIGTGFTDAERANPPPVGSRITFRHTGTTGNGIPRFASFLRIRDEP